MCPELWRHFTKRKSPTKGEESKTRRGAPTSSGSQVVMTGLSQKPHLMDLIVSSQFQASPLCWWHSQIVSSATCCVDQALHELFPRFQIPPQCPQNMYGITCLLSVGIVASHPPQLQTWGPACHTQFPPAVLTVLLLNRFRLLCLRS